MNQIGTLILHKRYGIAKVTHVWRKLINPIDKTTKLFALTFEILTDKGKTLFNKDRRLFYINDSLPRCYENNLSMLKLYKNDTKN